MNMAIADLYRVRAAGDTTVRTACEDAGCLAWRHGWDSIIDERTMLGQQQATYIRRESGRTFREMRDGELTVFRFEPGQRCFADHQTRPAVYLVTPTDEHGRAAGETYQHANGRDWMDDLQTATDTATQQRERG